MKTLTRFVLAIIAIMFITATLAEAQKPRLVTPPSPISQTGIKGRVTLYDNLQPVVGASIVVSLVREHWQTMEWFADHSTAKRFGPCEKGKATDCVRKDGFYTISAGSLPKSENQYDTWYNLDIRGEAPGHIHYLGNFVRVGLDGSIMTNVQDVYLYKDMSVGEAYAWWVDDRIIAFGFWANQSWAEDVIVDFILGGASWTVAQVQYGSVTTMETVGPGDGSGVWIEKQFWAPENGTASYGGSVCGTIQIRSAYYPEWVKAQIKEVCIPLKPPSGGKG